MATRLALIFHVCRCGRLVGSTAKGVLVEEPGSIGKRCVRGIG